MPVRRGTRFGPYEIDRLVGTGATGEVYRARDTTLQRDVAIKLLLPAIADSPGRLARFSREAQILASLNHPHIAQIHGFADAGGVRGLVMELVEGPTLADRIARGAIPIEEALPIARQIAEALEAAHERGVVHRDLKPANIKIREDGTVKILDFGLATAVLPETGPGVDPTSSPPLDALATADSVIFGTPAYMSPEQARGRRVDKRADLWAFGAVLYEMLTGRRAFVGAHVADTLAHVLMKEPDWPALPPATPLPIIRLLRRCLVKDRKGRLDSAASARLDIDDAMAAPAAGLPTRPVARGHKFLVAAAAALAGVAVLAALSAWLLTRRPPGLLESRFDIASESGQALNVSSPGRDLAISPDGRRVVYRFAGTNTAGSRLMIRTFDQLDGEPVPGVSGAYAPFFSPDGRWIGFFEDTKLKKVSIAGGVPVTLCQISGVLAGASWGDDNTIAFATNAPRSGLWRVSADGGAPAVLTTPDLAQPGESHGFPSLLPHGRGVLFTISTTGQVTPPVVAVLDLKTGRSKTLIRGGADAQYLDSGHLLFAVGGALRAIRFDPDRLDVTGGAVTVLEHVMMKPTGAADYAVSQSGTLAYIPGGRDVQAWPRSLVWVDREGHEERISAPPRAYGNPRLAPDGTRVAVGIHDENIELWIWDMVHENLRRLTFDPGADGMPLWTPDGGRIVFMSNREGGPNLYSQAADGTGPVDRLTTSANPKWPTSIAPDGRHIVGFQLESGTGTDVVLFSPAAAAPAAGPEGASAVGKWRTEPLVQTSFDESMAEISPDGRFVAYQSNQSGAVEIYVRPFPQVERGRWQVSVGGGTRPAWARSGRELFYLDGSNALTRVPVSGSGPTFTAGRPVRIFTTPYAEPNPSRHYDVSLDGERFLMLKDQPGEATASTGRLIVVLNWLEELKARVPAK